MDAVDSLRQALLDRDDPEHDLQKRVGTLERQVVTLMEAVMALQMRDSRARARGKSVERTEDEEGQDDLRDTLVVD